MVLWDNEKTINFFPIQFVIIAQPTRFYLGPNNTSCRKFDFFELCPWEE